MSLKMARHLRSQPEYPILKQGAAGTAVTILQRRLNQRFAEFDVTRNFIKVTGSFDADTHLAVKYLQKITCLPVDGVVGLQTWDFLWHGAVSLPILGQGNCGAMVWQIQETLKRIGYPMIVDGFFTTQLVYQLKLYQEINALTVTGVVDHPTWSSIIVERGKMPRLHPLRKAA
jgi:peptidoglycan hydrolase-like protein with peptidoglycan-binding domain